MVIGKLNITENTQINAKKNESNNENGNEIGAENVNQKVTIELSKLALKRLLTLAADSAVRLAKIPTAHTAQNNQYSQNNTEVISLPSYVNELQKENIFCTLNIMISNFSRVLSGSKKNKKSEKNEKSQNDSQDKVSLFIYLFISYFLFLTYTLLFASLFLIHIIHTHSYMTKTLIFIYFHAQYIFISTLLSTFLPYPLSIPSFDTLIPQTHDSDNDNNNNSGSESEEDDDDDDDNNPSLFLPEISEVIRFLSAVLSSEVTYNAVHCRHFLSRNCTMSLKIIK